MISTTLRSAAAGGTATSAWPRRLHDGLALAAALLLTLACGAIGAIASVDAPAFYAQLDKPAWAPPAGVFGPVWTTLYLLMGVALWLVWRQRRHGAGPAGALTWFGTQLVLNALWSWAFFGWHLGTLSLWVVGAMWAALLATTLWFWRVRPAAGALMLPTLAWVTFAGVLNASVVLRNPGLLG